jgi:hypothetical protein
MNNESLNIFLRLVQEKHEQLKSQITALSKVFVQENIDSKKVQADRCNSAAEDLARALSAKDQPNWLKEIIRWTKWYSTNHKNQDATFTAFQKIMPLISQLNSHEWAFTENTGDEDFDFDQLYERHKKDGKLEELFDTLINIIAQMVASGEIDSIRAKTDLERLIALLLQNKDGSYFSVMASWEFLRGFLKNTTWAAVDSIPVLKQLKKGFEDTVDEMDIELEKVHESIKSEMESKYNTAVHSLTYKSQAKLENKSEENVL